MNSRQPRSRRLIILLGLTILACGVGRAQGPSSQAQNPPAASRAHDQSTARTDAPHASRPVRLNMIVTGKSSNRVTADLRREDFLVEEDGVPQTITHFAREEQPVSYTLVVDNSGSLRSLLDYILSAAAVLVSANRPGDETSLTRFVSSDKIRVLEDFTAEREALMRSLSSMYIESGQTALVDAVYLSALNVAARRTGESGHRRRRALVLMTDGEDRVSHYKQSDLQKLLRKLDVQIFVVGLVEVLPKGEGLIRKGARDKAITLLNSLAQETGGRAFFPKNVKELQAAVNEIAQDLRTQYAISYQSSNANHDGKFRKIQVKLSETATGEKRTAHTRSGYFAPGAKGEEKKESKEKSPNLKFP